MSDFIIDFRKKEYANAPRAARLLKYYDDIHVTILDYKNFTLILGRPDDPRLWAPYKSIDGRVLVAIAGRIALDSKDWEAIKNYPGEGGLASKAIYQMYKEGGINRLHGLNGNFVILLYDVSIEKLYIITDRCGMFPCFKADKGPYDPVFGSHPDILAETCGLNQDLDITSLAEFLISGKVSFPFTYYKKIRAVDYGAIHTIDVKGDRSIYESGRKYFEFNYSINPLVPELELAVELGGAFKKAVNRRTLSLFGQTAISLSGGLDSRTLLCCVDNKDQIQAMCFFDEENLEFRLARDIAREAGVKLIPFKRSFEHYGDNAEMGVRISGGMGDFGSNHYLGFRDAFLSAGITNLITGFYCDYLFKGLVLNKKVNKILRRETLTSFRYQNYMPLFWFATEYSDEVRSRMDQTFPDNLKNDTSDLGLLRIEQRRLFPLCYEPDNQETTIPQRVLGWYLPTVDNDIIDVYLKIPPKYKLNTSLYSKMVERQCGEKIARITNINTGARVNAPPISLIFHGFWRKLQRLLRERKKSIATDESWPNWQYYVPHSPKVGSLWLKKNQIADDVFRQIMGKDGYEISIEKYAGEPQNKLFLRLLTLKLWLDQRV
jgi:asparagine synthase (glutamine-hydrolysing)